MPLLDRALVAGPLHDRDVFQDSVLFGWSECPLGEVKSQGIRAAYIHRFTSERLTANARARQYRRAKNHSAGEMLSRDQEPDVS
jgi:hypothetical protein